MRWLQPRFLNIGMALATRLKKAFSHHVGTGKIQYLSRRGSKYKLQVRNRHGEEVLRFIQQPLPILPRCKANIKLCYEKRSCHPQLHQCYLFSHARKGSCRQLATTRVATVKNSFKLPRENGAKAALFLTSSGFELQRSGMNSSALS